MAREFFWKKPFEKVGPVYNFDRSKGDVSIRWFEGGTTNISYNCLDRNIEKGFGSKTAIYYECNDLEDSHAAYSYSDVLKMVCKLANALKAEGVQKGDTGLWSTIL